MRDGRDEYPPEFDASCTCDVCGIDTDGCDCPECPKCGMIGDPKCYGIHGLKPAHDSVQSFMDHIGIEPIRDCLRAIEKHNVEHVWLEFRFDLPGLPYDKARVYYHDAPEVFAAIKPWMRLSGVGVGGIAWDGSDWEYAEVVGAGHGWGDLDAARERFHEALDDHNVVDAEAFE